MNKEELKRQIKLNSHLDKSATWRPASVYVPVIIDLIDQLDEPETDREKAYSKIAEEFPYSVPEIKMILSRCNQSGVSVANLLERISNHVEPEKPVVPQFVAEWYEKNKFESWWNWLYKWGKEPIEDELEKRVRDWFVDYHEYEFVDMHRIGYTVEKEKKYKVQLFDGHLLGRYQDGELAFVQGLTGATTFFTETEIKDIDSKLWPFAEEVKDDE